MTKEEAEKMCEEIGAIEYIECSARLQQGLTELFEAAVRCGLSSNGNNNNNNNNNN